MKLLPVAVDGTYTVIPYTECSAKKRNAYWSGCNDYFSHGI